MSIIYVLVPVALLIVLAALAGFRWAAARGQFDDLETPALRAIRDDAPARLTPDLARNNKEEGR
jgi:cbb3-type cytochrome oxidase maturation protein